MRQRVIARGLAMAASLAACTVMPSAGLASTGLASTGGGWAIQSTYYPPDSAPHKAVLVYSVSCPQAGACMAIGGYTAKKTGAADLMSETWNGTSWTPRKMLVQSGGSLPSAVSCSAADACTAVGLSQLAERWNGTSWEFQTVAIPPDSYFADLLGVSCPTATFCMAVGTYQRKGIDVPLTLAEQWNGTRWSVVPTPQPKLPWDELDSVSCLTPTDCVAAGSDYVTRTSAEGQRAVVESWNGTDWAIQKTPPQPGAGTWLTGVSCSAAASCTAVGGYQSSAVYLKPLIERWNGTSWQVQPLPGGQDIWLEGVSCASAASCTAAGTYLVNPLNPQKTEVIHWNGARWVIQLTPEPAGTTTAQFAGVSCPLPTTCTAVGDYAASRTQTLIEAS